MESSADPLGAVPVPDEPSIASVDEPTETRPAAIPLLTPREGVPVVIETADALRVASDALAAGTGPVAVDAERASGYRYGQRAYLIQLRREGSGSHLVDPIAVSDLSILSTALEGTEWVLHAASQDLPCLREVGLAPQSLFDTELAGRLLGYPRVGLSSLLEEVLGFSLAKEHSAADWSTRPLPESWLRYAALDVELLVELRDALEVELRQAEKWEWAQQEFNAARDAPPAAPRVDPWRRTSGMHKLRKPRQLAVIRGLWQQREEIARKRDISPGRILPDSAIVAAATTPSSLPDYLTTVPAFAGRGARRHLSEWQTAVSTALALPDDQLPAIALAAEGPPPPRAWPDKDPAAAARLSAARAGLGATAERLSLPVENLISPDLVRRLTWAPPSSLEPPALRAFLNSGGARPWQIDLTLPVLEMAVRVTLADTAPESPVAVETAPGP